jgi:hypothetical protein
LNIFCPFNFLKNTGSYVCHLLSHLVYSLLNSNSTAGVLFIEVLIYVSDDALLCILHIFKARKFKWKVHGS